MLDTFAPFLRGVFLCCRFFLEKNNLFHRGDAEDAGSFAESNLHFPYSLHH